MPRNPSIVLPIAILSLSPRSGLAERVPEQRETASHVVIGKVESVFSRDTSEFREFLVRIRVESVEKGDGVSKGDLFDVLCFQRKTLARILPGPSGHSVIPKEGQRIKAYAHRRSGGWHANYPSWLEILESR